MTFSQPWTGCRGVSDYSMQNGIKRFEVPYRGTVFLHFDLLKFDEFGTASLEEEFSPGFVRRAIRRWTLEGEECNIRIKLYEYQYLRYIYVI